MAGQASMIDLLKQHETSFDKAFAQINSLVKTSCQDEAKWELSGRGLTYKCMRTSTYMSHVRRDLQSFQHITCGRH